MHLESILANFELKFGMNKKYKVRNLFQILRKYRNKFTGSGFAKLY